MINTINIFTHQQSINWAKQPDTRTIICLLNLNYVTNKCIIVGFLSWDQNSRIYLLISLTCVGRVFIIAETKKNFAKHFIFNVCCVLFCVFYVVCFITVPLNTHLAHFGVNQNVRLDTVKGTMTKWPVKNQTLRTARHSQNTKTQQAFRKKYCFGVLFFSIFICVSYLFKWFLIENV